MRVCMFSEFFLPYVGGGQVHVYELSKALTKLGCEVHVICNAMENCRNHEEISGIHIHRVGIVGKVGSIHRRSRYILSSQKKAREIHRKNRLDIIHAHVPAGAIAGVMAGKTLGLPIVTTIHTLYFKVRGFTEEMPPLSKYMEKFIVKLPHDKIIAVSRVIAKQLKGLGIAAEKIEIIPNGVNLRMFNPKASSVRHRLGIKDGSVVSFFGRLWKVKGVEFLIKAVPLIVEKIPNAKFLIIGDGPQKESLMKLADDLNVSKYVKFCRSISYSEMPAYIKASDCVVLPSLMEGLPITALEAMGCGVPVIATRVGGTPEVVEDGKNGFLIEPRRPKSIAEKLIQLLKDEKLRKRMGEAGRKFAEKFDWDVIAGRTLEVYQEALKSR